MFSETNRVRWYDNIIGILEYFAGDRVFSNSEWAKWSDAGVLQAIQDGFRLYQNTDPIGDYASFDSRAAEEWKEFFVLFLRSDQDALPIFPRFKEWGEAEQAGVDYGLAIARSYEESANVREQIRIDTFVSWGNRYRSIVRSQVPIPYITTPTNSRSFVRNFSSLVVSPHADVRFRIQEFHNSLVE